MSESPSQARLALRDAMPVLLAILPFGAVYGTVAVDQGLTILQTLGFSASVYAGASQLVALQLLGTGAPLWAILVSMLALNFRHVLYSASTGRYLTRFNGPQKAAAFYLLVDPLFGAAETRAAAGELTKSYYFTYGVAIWIGWLLSTLVGAVFGGLIDDPRAFGLDFVLPVYFLTTVLGFRSRKGFFLVAAVSAVASAAVYSTIGSPWHVTLGGLAGIIVAAAVAPAGRRRLGSDP